jgi:putative ABC transport system permease protein
VRAFRAEHDGFSGVFAWADETVDVSTTGEARKIAATLLLSRTIGSLLFGVRASDPAAIAAAAALLAAVAALAVYVPVRRATGVDPAASLRCE